MDVKKDKAKISTTADFPSIYSAIKRPKESRIIEEINFCLLLVKKCKRLFVVLLFPRSKLPTLFINFIDFMQDLCKLSARHLTVLMN